MAPQVTVYFHKLPTTSSNQGEKKNRFLAAFSFDRVPISYSVLKLVEDVKKPTPARKAGKGKVVMDVSKTQQALRGKAAKGFKKRQTRSMKRSISKVGKAEEKPTTKGCSITTQKELG